MADTDPIRIDIEQVLRQRLPGLSRFIPRAAVRWMERTICQDRLNRLLQENAGTEGAEFARGVLRSLDIRLNVSGQEQLPGPSERRVLYVSNHPLGGLDGLALIDYVQQRHGGRVYFVVNDLLGAVRPLESVWLPVNKHGQQSRQSLLAIEEAFRGNDPIIMFPAGLCSRLQRENGRPVVKDLQWQKMFVNKAFRHQRNIIPLRFFGQNSDRFYRIARRRRRLGIKFNIEMIYLPSEMVAKEHSEFSIKFGSPVSWHRLTPGADAGQCAAKIREIVYNIE